ncbi:MAG TPA: MBL fold metallo-hydrolase [Vicinamibacterales bacterium]|nr:MBL fold metallo-hydrolase [Vicinamibacterales bacterium]
MTLNRREFVVLSSGAFAAAVLGERLWAQQAAAPPQTAFETIRGNVGFFSGRGGTIGWMVNKDAVVAVDTQFPDTAQIFVARLKERAAGRGIDVTINTHHHGDHTAGNGVFQGASKKLVAHTNVPELMKQFTQPNAPPPIVPTTTFDTSWSESVGDETVTVRHYGPAHTRGDAVIRFERADVVHMGDLLFHEMHPFVDRPGGAHIENWIRTLETVVKEATGETLFIAGHARAGQPVLVKREAVTQMRNYLDAVLAHVRKGIAEKKPQADIVSVAALPGFEHYQGSGSFLTLARTLTAAYEEAMEKR